MKQSLQLFVNALFGSMRDLLPIILVIAFFQIIVLQQTPENLLQVFTGLIFVVLGLTFFIFGLEQGLFPIGESMAHAFANKGSVFWLLTLLLITPFSSIIEPVLLIKLVAKVEVNELWLMFNTPDSLINALLVFTVAPFRTDIVDVFD